MLSSCWKTLISRRQWRRVSGDDSATRVRFVSRQNGIAERWVGSCRCEILDHVIALSEPHLRRLMRVYVNYQHDDRIHDSLDRDTASRRPMESKPSPTAVVISSDRLGGLHHRYNWREAARQSAGRPTRGLYSKNGRRADSPTGSHAQKRTATPVAESRNALAPSAVSCRTKLRAQRSSVQLMFWLLTPTMPCHCQTALELSHEWPDLAGMTGTLGS